MCDGEFYKKNVNAVTTNKNIVKIWVIWRFVVNKRTGIIVFFSNHVLSLCAICFLFRQG